MASNEKTSPKVAAIAARLLRDPNSTADVKALAASALTQAADKETTADDINELIKTCGVDTNLISDGYHTIGELYEHRIGLFIALCRIDAAEALHYGSRGDAWRSKAHSDGSVWDGWFILGMGKDKGEQITYHLPISKWNDCDFAETLDKAPDWDGHTSADVLERLKNL